MESFAAVTWQQLVMYAVGAGLIWLAIKKQYEPALLLPMGFGAILVNLPGSNAINQTLEGVGEVQGIVSWLYDTGIAASEALPLLLFIGIGAMIDFRPASVQAFHVPFRSCSQFGIFAALLLAVVMGFDLNDAASIGIVLVLQTDLLLFWYLRCCIQNMWEPLPWPPTLTWLWYPLYSLLQSNASPRKRSANSVWNTTAALFQSVHASCFPSLQLLLLDLSRLHPHFSRFPDVRKPDS